MNIYSIYKATNLINDKGYVGFTGKRNPKVRWTQHLSKARCNSQYYFYKAIRKYGIENFTFEIIYQSKDGEHTLNVMEEYFIRLHNTHCKDGWGYNMNYGGPGAGKWKGRVLKPKIHKTTFIKGYTPWNKGRKGLTISWNKGIKAPQISLANKDKTPYPFYHHDYGYEYCARYKLQEKYPEQNLRISHLGNVAKNKAGVKQHKGWIVIQSFLAEITTLPE